MSAVKSVYIHIPFCQEICSYCDFPKLYYHAKWINDYLDALDKEIKERYQHELIETIYIGGGTPSCLTVDELKKLFSILKQLNSSYQEFTIECNLENLTKEKIDLFKENHINRVSIGIQSFNQDNLTFLNRKLCHLELIDYMKQIGINNINVDLMYAIPGETKEILKRDLEKLKELDVPHISTYSLIIESNTMLSYRNTKSIEDDLDDEMYQLIKEELTDYEHYETSNFAKKGYESKHNLTYWNNEHYYGFGMGASGYLSNIRYTNTKSINSYIKGKYTYQQEQLSEKETMEYEMILGLRKLEGVTLTRFKEKYQKEIQEVFNIEKLLKEGKLLIEKDHLKINKKYIYLANDILINFVGEV